ncbi:hypothetical protein BDR22DRAFT_887562 [Usnea florida]
MLSRILVSKHAIQEEKGHEAASEQTKAACIARLAFAFLQSTLRFQADPTPFPFERLPPELCLQVYREVLRGTTAHGVIRQGKKSYVSGELITVSCNRKNGFVFRFGINEKGESKDIDVSLLIASKLVNSEALPLLYQSRTFDFATNVKLVMPFLSSTSAEARHHLRGIAMELHAKNEPDYCCGGPNNCYGKGLDNQGAWVKACAYIGQSVNVKELTVTVNVKILAEFKSLK